MSSMIPLTILSLDTDETVRNLREYNSAKEICKYPSFSKVGGNYPLDLKIIWSSVKCKQKLYAMDNKMY
jgi:hypothetical protein